MDSTRRVSLWNPTIGGFDNQQKNTKGHTYFVFSKQLYTKRTQVTFPVKSLSNP